jgi:hypothetical protein
LLELAAPWSALAGIAFVLTLGAGVATLFAVASIWRMRRDARVIEAAENFEAVNLTTVVKRYVPAEHQTNAARDEMAIAKQVIVAQRPRWKRTAVVFGMVLVCSATATVFFARRHLETTRAARLATKPRPNLDVLKYIQGVWGWRADFLQSCSENPQTISVAPDRKTLRIRYAKPYKTRLGTPITDLTFNVVSATSSALVLLWADPPAAIKPAPTDVQFIDANAMSWGPINNAMVSSGVIERCPPAQQVPARQ